MPPEDRVTPSKTKRNESLWVYAAVGFITTLWGLCAALAVTFVVDWNPYIVWMVAAGVANLAITVKVARGNR